MQNSNRRVARRCGRCSICSPATRRSGCSAPAELLGGQRVRAEAVRAGRSLETEPDDEKDGTDPGERDQEPPRGSIDIVKTPRGEREARQKGDQIEDTVER